MIGQASQIIHSLDVLTDANLQEITSTGVCRHGKSEITSANQCVHPPHKRRTKMDERLTLIEFGGLVAGVISYGALIALTLLVVFFVFGEW